MNCDAHTKNHLIGFGLAVLLTTIPFAAVWLGLFARPALYAIIALCAVVQILVHLRFFLNIRFGGQMTENKFALAFAIVLMTIMVAGTLWIMTNLNLRMM